MNNYSAENHDFVTILQTVEPCNKLVWVEDGEIRKKPAQPVFSATAKTIPVPDAASLGRILQHLGDTENATLCLGYVPGTENGEKYKITTVKKMQQMLNLESDVLPPPGLHTINDTNYATRTKDTFRQSSWFLFDYDIVEGMPDSINFGGANGMGGISSWLDALETLIPETFQVARVEVPSSSGRVITRSGEAWRDGRGFHIYMQAKDADDLERFAKHLFLQSLAGSLGFMRPIFCRQSGKVIGHRPWAFYDPTTFSPERLVFDGKPVNGSPDLLDIEPPRVRVYDGTRLDTANLENDEVSDEAIERKTGFKVRTTSNGQRNYH